MPRYTAVRHTASRPILIIRDDGSRRCLPLTVPVFRAGCIPARLAARVDPVTVLRQE